MRKEKSDRPIGSIDLENLGFQRLANDRFNWPRSLDQLQESLNRFKQFVESNVINSKDNHLNNIDIIVNLLIL